MKYHVTKDGRKIKLKDLELSHLKNIIKFIERRAKEGIDIEIGGGEWDIDAMWYGADTIYGEEVKKQLHYYDYVKELKRRNKKGLSIDSFSQDEIDIITGNASDMEPYCDDWMWK